MGYCSRCGKPTLGPESEHQDCRVFSPDGPPPPPPVGPSELATLLIRIEPIMQRAVFRGALFAMLAMTGIWLVLSFLYYIATH